MRMPHVRFTMRLLMIAVAILASLFWVERLRRLSQEYRSIAEEHGWAVFGASEYAPHNAADAAKSKRIIDRYRSLQEKYERAARHPWLPVEPDPPEPG
jgi:hypothetical protein